MSDPVVDITGYPNVKYQLHPVDLGAWDQAQIAVVLNAFNHEWRTQKGRFDADLRVDSDRALRSLEDVTIDVVEHDFSLGFAQDYVDGATASWADQGDHNLATAQAGVADTRRGRVLVALRRPDGSCRSISRSALVHELIHQVLYVADGDADSSHERPPGPWSEIYNQFASDVNAKVELVIPDATHCPP
jgi:hypothetical protein